MAKYVIEFSPEYCATSLWAKNDKACSDFGNIIEYEDVGLPAELIERLKNFDDSVMGLVDWDHASGDFPLTYEEQNKLYEEGLQLLQLVRDELGADYVVLDGLNWIKPKPNND